MGNGSGVSRGDRNRNARLGRRRVLVPVENAIVGIDLADCFKLLQCNSSNLWYEPRGGAPRIRRP
jgi:hypothetical protein